MPGCRKQRSNVPPQGESPAPAAADEFGDKDKRATVSGERLWNKNFTLLWQGQLVAVLGNQASYIAMAFWIKEQTGSAMLMGLVMMASQATGVLLAPLGGAYVDNHSRKAILVLCNLLNGMVSLSVAGVFFLWPDKIDWGIAVLFTASVMNATTGTFFQPAVFAAIPDIVPPGRLNAANSLYQGSLQISSLVGLSVGGVLFRLLGVPVLYLIDGVSSTISGFLEIFMVVPFVARDKTPDDIGPWRKLGGEISEGYAYIWTQAGMRNVVIMMAILNIFSAPVIVLLPFYVGNSLGASADWFGYLGAAYSGGMIVGYMSLGTFRLGGRLRGALMIAAIISTGALMAALGAAPTTWAAAVILFLVGITNGFFNVGLQTLFQVTTTPAIRGRVFSLINAVSGALTPIAMGLTGVVADLMHQNIRLLYGGTGTLCLIAAILFAFNSPYRVYLAHEPRMAVPGSVGGE